MRNFRLYPGLKFSFGDNNAQKKHFLGGGLYWNSTKCSLCEIDPKNQNLQELLAMVLLLVVLMVILVLGVIFSRRFKVFSLHTILEDAAGAVPAQGGKKLGYCYMIGRVQKSCLLCHVTGLLFAFM